MIDYSKPIKEILDAGPDSVMMGHLEGFAKVSNALHDAEVDGTPLGDDEALLSYLGQVLAAEGPRRFQEDPAFVFAAVGGIVAALRQDAELHRPAEEQPK